MNKNFVDTGRHLKPRIKFYKTLAVSKLYTSKAFTFEKQSISSPQDNTDSIAPNL